MRSLKLGIPSGSLSGQTIELLKRIGIRVVINGRSFKVRIEGIGIFSEGLIFRPESIPIAVQRGVVDCGITGWDWVVENGMENKVFKIAEFGYSKKTTTPVRIVVYSLSEKIVDNKNITVSAEYLSLAKKVFKKAQVYFSSGGTEANVVAGLYDYGIGVTETGDSIRDNRLNLLETILVSPVVLISKEESPEIGLFGRMLEGALASMKRQSIKMNVSTKGIKEKVIKILPALRSPTVSGLADGTWAVETVVSLAGDPEKEIPSLADLIMELTKIGATGIITQDINLVL